MLEASSVKLLGRRPVEWSRHSSTVSRSRMLCCDTELSCAGSPVARPLASEWQIDLPTTTATASSSAAPPPTLLSPLLQGLIQLSSGRKALLSQDQITRFGAQLQTPDKCEELSESGQKFVADHPYIGAQYMRTRKGAPDRELAQLRTQLDTSACDRCVPRRDRSTIC